MKGTKVYVRAYRKYSQFLSIAKVEIRGLNQRNLLQL